MNNLGVSVKVKKLEFQLSLAALALLLGYLSYCHSKPPVEQEPNHKEQKNYDDKLKSQVNLKPNTIEKWIGQKGRIFNVHIGSEEPNSEFGSITCQVKIFIENPFQQQLVGNGKLTISNNSPCSLEITEYKIGDLYGSLPKLTLIDGKKWVGTYISQNGIETGIYWSRISTIPK